MSSLILRNNLINHVYTNVKNDQIVQKSVKTNKEFLSFSFSAITFSLSISDLLFSGNVSSSNELPWETSTMFALRPIKRASDFVSAVLCCWFNSATFA